MDDYKDIFPGIQTFDGLEIFRQMQEKKQMEEESKMLNDEPTISAAEAVPAVREEKTADKRKRQNDKPSSQTLQRVRISITESDMQKMRCLLMLPDSPIRKGLREVVAAYIQEQFKKNGKQLKNMFNKDMLNSLDL